MNRLDEYRKITAELDNLPPALDYTMTRAQARIKKNKFIKRWAAVPAGIGIFFGIFVMMVNLSMTFALACGQIPLLRELTAAVAFSPSLAAAVKNQYVQPINQEKIQDGIKFRVEYVIVDQKQINFFYTMTGPEDVTLDVDFEIGSRKGEKLEGYTLHYGDYGASSDEFGKLTVDFVEGDVPEGLYLTCRVYERRNGFPSEEKPQYLSVFVFGVSFDPSLTQKGEILRPNLSFTLDGQTFTVSSFEIYPTQIRVELQDDPKNTAWIKDVECYIEDEKGNRFETVGNGLSSTGAADSPKMTAFYMESPFFYDSKELTLHVTGATWLDKDKERVRVSLKDKTADFLPEGIVFEKAEPVNTGWELTFTGEKPKDEGVPQIIGQTYYDLNGKDAFFEGWSVDTYLQPVGEDGQVMEGYSQRVTLKDYSYDTVYLTLSYSRTIKLGEPLALKIK